MNGYGEDISFDRSPTIGLTQATINGLIQSPSRYPRKRSLNEVYPDDDDDEFGNGENDNNVQDSVLEAAANYRATPAPDIEGVLPSQSQRIYDEMSSSIQNTQQSYGRDNGPPGGTILKIHVVNFMCHKNLEIDLGPRINFIVGHNGSGKSAILTALSVCLGGKVSNTDRGKSLRELIRRGESRASVSVFIQNTGTEAYQHQHYGDVIEIVRTFSTDGSQGYKLKSERGRNVSQKKEELLSILDRFQILIDNPLAILSQDAARSFLTSSTPNSLYNFLSQGINHEAMKRTIQNISASSSETQSGIEPLRKEFNLKKSALDKLKKEFNERKSVRELSKNKSLLEIKIQWKIVELKNQAIEQAEKELQLHRQKIETATRRFRERDTYEHELLEKIDTLKAEHAKAREEHNAAKEEYREFENELNKIREESKNVSKQIDEIDKELRRTGLSISTLEGKIKEEQLRLNGGFEEAQRQNMIHKEELVEQLTKVQALLAQTETRLGLLESGLENVKQELEPLKERKEELQIEMKDTHAAIMQVQSANQNFINVFPPQMRQITELIRQNAHKFKKLPIGPVGQYITLRDPKWASVLSRQFRNTLNAFVVTHPSDRAFLQNMMHKVKYHTSIIVSRVDLYEYEHTMPDRKKYEVLLDILDISDEHIKRVMIDQHKVESIILASNREEAENIMYHERPQRASLCYCLTGPFQGAVVGGGARGSSSIMPIQGLKPPYAMRTENVGQTEALEQDLHNFRDELLGVDREVKEIQNKLNRKNHEREECESQFGKLRKDRNRLTKEIERLDQELSQEIDTTLMESLKEQLDIEIDRQRNYKPQLKSAYEEKERTNNNLSDASGFARQAKEVVIQCEQAEYTAGNKLQAGEEELQQFNREKDNLQKIVDNLNSAEVQMKKYLEKLTKEALESEQAAIKTKTKRMKVPEDMNTLTNNHKEVTSRLRAAETQYGDRSFEGVSRDVIAAAEALKKAKQQFVSVNTTNSNIREMLIHREKRYEQILRYTTTRICQEFQHILKQRDFEGQLDINHDRRIMTIKCAPKTKGGATAQRDTRSLSGGEKSFSQIALLLSVWSVMSCNIRGLDEFDVFMDEVNRKVSMKLMIRGISEMKNGQTIFITPNNMADINVNKNDVKIFRLPDPER